MSYDPVQEQKPETTETAPAQEQARNFTPNREQREQLKNLSKEIFGASSKWQKLMEYDHVLTHKVKETVPGENGEPDTEREVEVPLYAKGTTKVKQSVRKHRSIEEILTLLLDFKAKRDEYIAKVKAAQEEAKKKREEEEQARKVQEQLGGSALT